MGTSKTKIKAAAAAAAETPPPTPAQSDESIVIRSLRRRFRQALAEDDAIQALRIYQASRADWERWCLQEAHEQQQAAQAEQTREARPRFLSRFLGTRSSKTAASVLADDEAVLPTTLLAAAATISNHSHNGDNEHVTAGLLQSSLIPSDPFLLDDYYSPHDSYETPVDERIPATVAAASAASTKSSYGRPMRQARQAFAHFKRNNNHSHDTHSYTAAEAAAAARQNAPAATIWDHPDRTTALHEAARLGCSKLLKPMLGHEAVDATAQNGSQRTALHMIAGGCYDDTSTAARISNSDEEEDDNDMSRLDDRDEHRTFSIAIGPPRSLLLPPQQQQQQQQALATASRGTRKKTVQHLGRLIRETSSSILVTKNSTNGKSSKDLHHSLAEINQPKNSSQKQEQERLDVALALLAWSSPSCSSNSISTNTVDSTGRTALHYAAACGRTDMALAIANSFVGTLLTVVDDVGRTPCEWAAASRYTHLAAQLEARALLYMDPYGMDEELLTGIKEPDGFSKSSLVPPFCWSTTLSTAAVRQDRERRLDVGFRGMELILSARQDLLLTRSVAAAVEADDFQQQHLQHEQRQQANNNNNNNAYGSLTEEQVAGGKLKKEQDEQGQEAHGKTIRATDEQDNACGWSSLEKQGAGGKLKREQEKEGGMTSKDTQTPAPPGEGNDALDARSGSASLKTKELLIESELEYQAISRLLELMNKTHTEIFMAAHNWDVEAALCILYRNPLAKSLSDVGLALPPPEQSTNEPAAREQMCLICCEMFDTEQSTYTDWRKLSSCAHGYCAPCLGEYLAQCAESRSTGLSILCPHHECRAPLSPMQIVEWTPTRHVYDALTRKADENFIVSAADITFCPHPACSGVVRFQLPASMRKFVYEAEGLETDILEIAGAVCTAVGDIGDDVPLTYEGVGDPMYYQSHSSSQPKAAHRFCFCCGQIGTHWPVPCAKLAEWKDIVKKRVGEVQGDSETYTDVAQKLWMKANTKPCPRCHAPIIKNDGCNHMTCGGCSHEFCWICRKDWRLHSTQTGGFFRCNRWVEQKGHEFYDDARPDPAVVYLTSVDLADPLTMQATYGTAMHESRVSGKKAGEMNRFLHHYRRWNAHRDSAELEKKMKETVCQRLAPVVRAAEEFSGSDNFVGLGLSFVHAAFTELLECRSSLQHSYAYSYLRYKFTDEVDVRKRRRLMTEQGMFEEAQGDLEMITEQISDIVARAHLRATQTQIRFLTAAAMEKRRNFIDLMVHVLVEEKKNYNADNGIEINPDHLRNLPTKVVKSIFDSIRNPESDGNREMQTAIQASHRVHEKETSLGGAWTCETCTYDNAGGRRCSMCDTLRINSS